MSQYKKGLASIILVNYNGADDIETCISSILAQGYRNFEVIFVDSGSTDKSVSIVESRFPQVRLIKESNIGYGAGNNLGFELARGEYFVVSNTDVEVHPDWLYHLVQAAEQDGAIGLVAPKILFFDDRNTVNGCGDLVNFAGFATSRGRGKPSSHFNKQEDLFCPSGASFLIKRSVVQKVGMMDLRFQNPSEVQGRTTQYYYQAADLAWRAILAGHRVILEPRSHVYHKYVVKSLTSSRFEDIENARLAFILSNYSTRTLAILAPSLLVAELISFGFGLLNGITFVRAKWSSYQWLWRNRHLLAEKRRHNQGFRTTPDSKYFRTLSPEIEFTHQTGSGGILAFIELALNAVFRVLYSLSYLGIRAFS